MRRVAWSTTSMSTKAQIWRILDLGGFTKSVRDSRNFTKSGYVFVDGNQVLSLKETVSLGSPFTLELRFPNGRTISDTVVVVPSDRTLHLKARQTGTTVGVYKK